VATATAQHYATVDPYTGEVLREFESLDAAAVARAVESAHREHGAAGIEEFANRKLICAVAPDAPVGGFAG
jgi:acyl-CoA reductase-like NAD-dependent aldehyde dehydrogenase